MHRESAIGKPSFSGLETAAAPDSSQRATTIAVGLLFFVATATYLAGSALVNSALAGSVESHATPLRIGLFLELVNAAAVVGIGVLLYPILCRYNAGLALAYAGARIIEATMLLVSAGGTLFFESLGRDEALRWHDLTFQVAMIALGVGSLALCGLLYRYRLVPRPLVLLGLLGYVALIAYAGLALLGQDLGPVLFIPGALFEVLFPLWLIVKGFSRSAAGSAPAV